jgi:hypothetical protein
MDALVRSKIGNKKSKESKNLTDDTSLSKIKIASEIRKK